MRIAPLDCIAGCVNIRTCLLQWQLEFVFYFDRGESLDLLGNPYIAGLPIGCCSFLDTCALVANE